MNILNRHEYFFQQVSCMIHKKYIVQFIFWLSDMSAIVVFVEEEEACSFVNWNKLEERNNTCASAEGFMSNFIWNQGLSLDMIKVEISYKWA